jgi:hypothetical protein
MPFGFPPERAFSFTGIPTRRPAVGPKGISPVELASSPKIVFVANRNALKREHHSFRISSEKVESKHSSHSDVQESNGLCRLLQARSYMVTQRRFIIFANLGHRPVTRRTFSMGAEAKITANNSRCSIAFAYQSAAASISEQTK